MPDFEKLEDHVARLHALLADPDPALASWCEAVGEQWKAIALAWGKEPLRGPVEASINLKSGGRILWSCDLVELVMMRVYHMDIVAPDMRIELNIQGEDGEQVFEVACPIEMQEENFK